VLTAAHPGAQSWDATQRLPIRRARLRVLVPTPPLVRVVRRVASELGAGLVVLDPILPLGLIGPHLGLPYALVAHGAEVTVPGRLPGTRRLVRRVLGSARGVVAAGEYPAAEVAAAARALGVTEVAVVPPGVDLERFRPLGADERAAVRRRFGLPLDANVVLSVSRLVPRKGMDTLIEATYRVARSRPGVLLVIAGDGRDRARLMRLARRHTLPVRFLGRVGDDVLPLLYGSADVFALLCRNRWAGLEQEGFGIVFLEAAACGVAVVAGRSGGAAEAVADGRSGVVLQRSSDAHEAAEALAVLLSDPARRAALGAAGRQRAEALFSYDAVAARLRAVLQAWAATPGRPPG